jgi:hypothetical protein
VRLNGRGPPVEIGSGLDSPGLELAASFSHHGVERIECREVAVDHGLIEQRPQALGWLKFGRIGRQEDEADPVRDGQTLGSMPTGVVEHEDDAAGVTGTARARERRRQRREPRLADAVAQIPEGLAAAGLHEGGDVEPQKAVVTEGNWTLTHRRPDAAANWLQAEAMLVCGPDLDWAIWMRGRDLFHGTSKPFLKAACSSGVAAAG